MPPATLPTVKPGTPLRLLATCLGIIGGLVGIIAAGRTREWEPRVSALEQQVGEIKPAVARIDERTAGMKDQLNQIQRDVRRDRQP
jgi:hypothetical protein